MTNLENIEPPPNAGDVLLGRVILCVFLFGLMALAFIGACALLEREYPSVLDNLATAALVGLTGLLAARRT